MIFRIGDVFLFGLCLLAIYFCFSDRSRPKESQRAQVVEERGPAATKVKAPSSAGLDKDLQPALEAISVPEMGRKANVGGLSATFECVEYRFDDRVEVYVRQIDEKGRPLAPPIIHLKPFEDVVATYTDLTSF